MYQWPRAAQMQSLHLHSMLHCCSALDKSPHKKSHVKAMGAEGTQLLAVPRFRDRQWASRSAVQGIALIQISNSEVCDFSCCVPKTKGSLCHHLFPRHGPKAFLCPPELGAASSSSLGVSVLLHCGPTGASPIISVPKITYKSQAFCCK